MPYLAIRTFPHFPQEICCPICGTSLDRECILVPIDGTQEGNICEGKPVHLACAIPTHYNPETGMLYRRKGETP